MKLLNLSFLFLSALLLSASAQAGLYCSKIHAASFLRDSAVEIEISGTVVDPLMTTLDGTLRPLVGELGVEGLPKELRQSLESTFPGQDPLTAEWDLLTSKEKQQLILYVAKTKNQNFFKNRNVEGLKYRDTFQMTFREPTTFLGKNYAAGKHTFQTSEVFGGTKIEFSGPEGMKENLGVEIHLRTSQSAGTNFQASAILQKGLTSRVSSVHEHIVAEMPLEQMSKNPELTALKMVEFYRRVSLFTQTLRALKGHEIEELRVTTEAFNYLNMPILKRTDLAQFNTYFKNFGNYLKANSANGIRGLIEKLKVYFDPNLRKNNDLFSSGEAQLAEKSGLVGIRAGSVYDGTITQWGLEMRDLSPSHDQKVLTRVTDAVQKRMLQQEFGISDKILQNTLEQSKKMPVENILLYPSVAKGGLRVDKMPMYAKKFNIPKLAEYKTDFPNNEAIGFLFHDWANDPLILQYPGSRKQVLETQVMALKYLANGMNINEVIIWFIKKSALNRLLFESIAGKV